MDYTRLALDLLAIIGGLGAVIQMILHLGEVKRLIFKPNFKLDMRTVPYDEGYNAHIYIENVKNKTCVGDATECRVRLRVFDHSSQESIKDATPLRWEQTGNDFNPRIPAGSSPFDLFALRFDPRTGVTSVNVCQGSKSTSSALPQSRDPVDIEVTIESKEKTITARMRKIKLPEQFQVRWPQFIPDS
jgi:hypothetical protein